MIIDILQYDFVVRALIVGSVTAVAAAMLGNFVVAARQSTMSDMLAHTALAGVGLGIFLHMSPSFFALIVSVFASILLWWMTRHSTRAPEAVAMLLLSGGLAIALIFAHLAKDNPVSFDTFLFGSILTITQQEMVLFIVISALVVGILIMFWRMFIMIVFDQQFAHVQSRHAAFFEIILMVLVGFLVAVSLKVIGGLLVGALLVIPVLSAQNIAQSFRANVLWSVFLGASSTLLGIIVSFYIDIPASSGIVLSLITLFLVTLAVRYMRLR